MDRIDRALIRALRRNARATNVALAAEAGLSPSACLRRVQMLEESGAIRGYTAIVAGPGGDDAHVVIVRITLEHQTEDVLHRFEAEVLKHPEIRECYLMTGAEDYLLRVEAQGAGDYERIHKEILSRLPAVSRINSSFAIRRVLSDTGGRR
ncbi:Lrp/AsnC family transcriptional regulator [Aureimonas phyllosphaerae]|uniref:DNA-binding Lrp family transcriptional regulator n=1 Tax=Aureimonas phyllosphaerae TaxID=1166078 RepID=A0A7W6BTJ6_9HYPH|nr:Lrp/AsnC family transcriptional regulator [Aureimonas phyllosphaerae]MBB3936035.1 DNA-binding Lrp family transcriptional regulator [Aureimonas phyllosphaerae]MBB3960240.1 DNA-binding Lrp family transcriptional regulator [Aureimonas phyllosphaerae]SFF35435.1 transcriptional regulator, AsnC family [Aureimonas phyllosphaerae]